jgi:hypothetical protein
MTTQFFIKDKSGRGYHGVLDKSDVKENFAEEIAEDEELKDFIEDADVGDEYNTHNLKFLRTQ